MKSILVSGYYGHGNAGDEAMLAGIVGAVKSLAPEASITVLSSDPVRTAKEHGVQSIGRMDFKAIRRSLSKGAGLLFGGGSLLQDATSFRSLLYYAGLAMVASTMHRPVVFYGQGIGPLQRRLSRAIVRRVLGKSRMFVAREEGTLAELKRLGITKPVVRPGTDPAFLLPIPDPAGGQEVLARSGLATAGAPVMALVPRAWHAAPVADLLAAAGTYILEHLGALPVLLPLHPDDQAICQQISDRTGGSIPVLAGLGYDETLAVVARCDLVVSVRLHGLVFAALAARPFVGVSYDPKVKRFCESMGGQPCVELAEGKMEDVLLAIEASWHAREAVSAYLAAAREDKHKLAVDSLAAALAALGIHTAGLKGFAP